MSPGRLSGGLLVAAIGLLLLVGVSGESVALPPLGDPGWAPPALPWTLAPWLVVVLQASAYLLGGASLVVHLRRPTPLRLRWWHLAGLAALVLLTAPFGTADHTNYAGYGRILAQGGNPWVVAPEDFRGGEDPVTWLVQPPWRDTPSVYGPVGTWLMGLAGLLGGESMRQVVWVWQAFVVAAWLGVRALLVRLGSPRPVVDRWWTTNVLVLGAGVLGAHLDTLALAAMVAALAAGLARRPLLAGLLTGVAASTKITAGVVGLALVVGWVMEGARPLPERLRRAARPTLLLAAGTLAVLVPLHLLAGREAVSQVVGSGGGVSYATPWRAVYTVLDLGLPELAARNLTIWVSAAACLALALALWPVTAALERWPAVRALLVLTTAYSLVAAYVLPWYELMQWASLTLALGLLVAAARGEAAPLAHHRGLRLLLLALLLRGTVLALAYVPGRVRLPADVETVTLGFRFVASPLATVAVWGVVIVLWRRTRSSRRPTAPAGPSSRSATTPGG